MQEKNPVLEKLFTQILERKAQLQPNHVTVLRVSKADLENLDPKHDKFVEDFTAIALAAGGHHPDRNPPKDWRTRVAEFCQEHDLKWSEPYDELGILELQAKRERVTGRVSNEAPLELEVQKALKNLVGLPEVPTFGYKEPNTHSIGGSWRSPEPHWVRVEVPIDYPHDVCPIRIYADQPAIIGGLIIPRHAMYQEIKLERRDFVLEGKHVGLWFALEGEALGSYGSLLRQTLYWDIV
jgi:hypothetical protein